MTYDVEVTDLFAELGGSSTGALMVPGMTVRTAAGAVGNDLADLTGPEVTIQ